MTIYNSFVFTGHGKSEVNGSYDPGATSQAVKENDLAGLITAAARTELQTNPKTKHLSIHYDEQNYVDNDTSENSYTSKSGISVHINAGGGTGPEVWVPCKEKYLDTDFAIVANIADALGVPNRGVKSRDYNSEKSFQRTNGQALGYLDYYKEIRQAWEKGISLSILEVGFIDSSDLTKMQSKIKDIGFEVAKYIAKANNIELTKYIAPPIVTSQTTPQQGKLYRICVGSFGSKDNAIKALEQAKASYPTAFIHEC